MGGTVKKLVLLACSLVAVVLFCLGAGTVTYTAFFPNIQVYTNAIVGTVWIDGTGAVSMNYDSANINFGTTSDTTILRTSAGSLRVSTNLAAKGVISSDTMVATNGITTGASTFTGVVTVPQLITYSVRPRNLVLTHAGTVTLDFSTNTYQKLVLTGAVTLAFSNLETNRTYQLTIANAQATNCSYVLPAVTYLGYYPTNIVAGKVARWWFDVDPQTNSIVYATYAEQQ